MFWKKMTLSLILGLGLSLAVEAATINVPADEPTIQDAANAAVSGDTIIVAPGDYAGAEIFTTVRIVGSGPTTRVTAGLPPWGDGLKVIGAGAADTEIRNLAIELLDPAYPWSAGVVIRDGANNCIVKDLQITAGYGVFCAFSDNAVVTGNEILGTPFVGINPIFSHNFVASGNTITGPMECGIDPFFCNDFVASGNTITGPMQRGIWPERGDNATITDNTITGEMWCAIHCWRMGNSVVSNNTMSVSSAGIAVVFVSASSNLAILDNDYTGCDVPGWTSADGPGAVLLADGTSSSFVFESGNFPPGTGGAMNQVLDLTKELTGSTTNRIIGHPANFLADDLNPGIGQRLQEIIDQLPDPVEEAAVRP